MNILVIYNGTPNSKAALKRGIGEIKRHCGRLIIFYSGNGNSFNNASGHISAAKRILEKENIKPEIIIGSGNTADEITGHVREKGIDIILSNKKRYKLNHENGGYD